MSDSFDGLFGDSPKPKSDDFDDLFGGKERRRGEAFLEGAAGAASLGFVDELTGVAMGVLNTKPARWLREKTGIMAPYEGEDTSFSGNYKLGRDSKREDIAELRAAEPAAFNAGQVAGTVATAAIPIAGAGKLAQAGRVVAEGAASGLGSSEADLTKDDWSGAARDTAIGAAVGAVGAGIGAAGGALASRLGPKAPAVPGSQRQFGFAGPEFAPAQAVAHGAKAVEKPISAVANLARAGRDIAIGYGVDEIVRAAGKEGLPVGVVLGALSAARRVRGSGGSDLSKKTIEAFKGKKFTADAVRALMKKLPEATAKLFAAELVRGVGGDVSSPESDSFESLFGS
jgi:hypothetical protein